MFFTFHVLIVIATLSKMPHRRVPYATRNTSTLDRVVDLKFGPDTVAACFSIPKFSLGLNDDGIYQKHRKYFTSCSSCLKYYAGMSEGLHAIETQPAKSEK
jgi:hypothetical protein